MTSSKISRNTRGKITRPNVAITNIPITNSAKKNRSSRFGKRGELSMTMIVVAILVLIVLIVVAAIFSGKLKTFSVTSASCGAKGGVCYTSVGASDKEKTCPQGTTSVLGGGSCPEKNDVCCVNLEKTDK